MTRHLALSSFLTSLLALSTLAVRQDVIVDDTQGDEVTGLRIVYNADSGASGWNQGNGCKDCAVTGVDTTRVHDNTWHDGTVGEDGNLSLQYSFTGYAIQAFFILAGSDYPSNVIVNTDLNFEIDGDLVGTYSFDPSAVGNTDFRYNQSLYSNSSLSNAEHTIKITTSPNSLILFDYLIYTTDNATLGSEASSSGLPLVTPTSLTSDSGSSQNSSGTPVGAIAGGVVGGVVAVAALIGLLFWCRRSRRRSHLIYDGNGSKSIDVITPIRVKPRPGGGGITPYSPTQARDSKIGPSALEAGARPNTGTSVTSMSGMMRNDNGSGVIAESRAGPHSSQVALHQEIGAPWMQQADPRPVSNKGTIDLQHQVRYLMDEVARLRSEQPPAQSQRDDTTSTEHASGTDAPPDYVTEISGGNGRQEGGKKRPPPPLQLLMKVNR